MKNWIGGVVTAVVLLAIGAGGAYWFMGRGDKVTEQPSAVSDVRSPTPVASSEPVVEEERVGEESNISTGWLTYEGAEHGFEISYPSGYEALDDSNSLYGWENGIVLLYGGGQSYDIAVEIWDTEVEYESKYPGGNYVVIAVGGKYITATNLNMTPEGAQILATFGVGN